MGQSQNATGGGDVSSKVQSAIQQDVTLSQNANVNVNVQNNQLVLTGTVPNEEAKRRAEQIAQSTAASSGLAVVNQITVSSAGSSTVGATTNPCPQGTTAAVGTTNSTNAATTTGTAGATASGMPQSDINQSNTQNATGSVNSSTTGTAGAAASGMPQSDVNQANTGQANTTQANAHKHKKAKKAHDNDKDKDKDKAQANPATPR